MSRESTEKLRENLEVQLKRLLQQIDDLTEVKDEMDPEEYERSRAETLEEIIDVNNGIKKLDDGNMTLIDSMESKKQLTREAISKAFCTPEVIRMFARREPEQLRQWLKEKERDFKLGKVVLERFNQDKRELLIALRQLGERLTIEDERFLEDDQSDNGQNFEPATEETDATSALKWAKKATSTSMV